MANSRIATLAWLSALAWLGQSAIAAAADIQFVDVTQQAGLNRTGQSYGASWGDVDGDGYPDLWTNNHGNPPSLFRNNGNSTFTNITSTYWPGNMGDKHGASWVDFDNDGDQDLLELVGGLGANNFYVNTGSRFVERGVEFNLAQPVARGRTPVWYDWDRDGYLDLIMTHQTGLEYSPLMLSNGRTRFDDAQATVGIPDLNSNVAFLADFTEDGFPDILFSNGSSSRGPMFSMSTVPFTPVDQTVFASFPGVIGCYDSVTADFTGDRRTDIFSVCAGGQREVASCGFGCVQMVLVVTSTEHSFKFSTPDPIALTVIPYDTFDRQQHFHVGSANVTPPLTSTNDVPGLSFLANLDPTDTTFWGTPSHQPGVDLGVFVGFNPDTQEWNVGLSVPNARSFAFIVRSTSAISAVTTTGFSGTPAAANPVMLRRTDSGFVNETNTRGLGTSMPCPSAVAADFDNDMDIDIFAVCSHVITNIPDRLFLNDGTGHFQEVPSAAGAGGSVLGSGDSVTTVDYNNDGFLDLFVTNGRGVGPFNLGPNQLFRNTGNGNYWLSLKLEGSPSNRDAIGAVVSLLAGGKWQDRLLDGGMHLHAQNHQRLHFGLGANSHAQTLQIRWPSGNVEIFNNVPAGRILRLKEDSNSDVDSDGRIDVLDNCLNTPNSDQTDSDLDGYGNICDADLNNDGVTNAQDTAIMRTQLGLPSTPPTYNIADLNGNGSVNAQDTAMFRQLLGAPPGPSGITP